MSNILITIFLLIHFGQYTCLLSSSSAVDEKIIITKFNKTITSFFFISRWIENINLYFTLCAFCFEINESRLSDTKCLIQYVGSPHCGDKRMVRRCTRRSLPNYFVMTSYHWNVRENKVTRHRWINGKYNVTSCSKCSLLLSIAHILI